MSKHIWVPIIYVVYSMLKRIAAPSVVVFAVHTINWDVSGAVGVIALQNSIGAILWLVAPIFLLFTLKELFDQYSILKTMFIVEIIVGVILAMLILVTIDSDSRVPYLLLYTSVNFIYFVVSTVLYLLLRKHPNIDSSMNTIIIVYLSIKIGQIVLSIFQGIGSNSTLSMVGNGVSSTLSYAMILLLGLLYYKLLEQNENSRITDEITSY